MNHSLKTGFSFGSTSGIITTLGLIVGLNSSTSSKIVIIGGILTIAIADAFSDALGIHISEESENKHTAKEIWQSTISTFLSKFFFALTFMVPILLFELKTAMIINVIWGMSMLGIFSYYMAKKQKVKPLGVVSEHLFITITVVIITNYIGFFVGKIFK